MHGSRTRKLGDQKAGASIVMRIIVLYDAVNGAAIQIEASASVTSSADGAATVRCGVHDVK